MDGIRFRDFRFFIVLCGPGSASVGGAPGSSLYGVGLGGQQGRGVDARRSGARLANDSRHANIATS